MDTDGDDAFGAADGFDGGVEGGRASRAAEEDLGDLSVEQLQQKLRLEAKAREVRPAP